MADIAISYSHADRETAEAVREELRTAGYSVWMDETGEYSRTAEAVNLPVGQQHWEVIQSEFAAADLVIVLDTPRWRASPYCRKEFEFLLQWGKWTAFHVPGSGPVVAHATELVARRRVTGAHTRIVALARSNDIQSRSLVERLLRRSEAEDAEIVLSADAPAAGISVDETLKNTAVAVMHHARRARRRLWQGATTATAILAVLAVVGAIAWTVAVAQRDAATRSANFSQSLNLASRSLDEVDSGRSLGLANEAVAHSDTPAAVEALEIATANDRRLRTFAVDRREYVGAAWAPDAPVIVAYSRTALQQFDARTGRQLGSITLDEDTRIKSIAVSASGRTVAFTDGDLNVADFASGTTRQVIGNVELVATGDGTDIWYSTPWDGGALLNRAAFADIDEAVEFRLPARPTAMTVDARQRILDYTDGRGKLHTAKYTDSGIQETAAIEIVPETEMESTSSGASVTRCGDNVFGLIPKKTIWEASFAVTATGVTVDRAALGLNRHVCNSDSSAWATGPAMTDLMTFAGAKRPYIPWGANRYVTALDTTGSRAAVITPDGWLYIMPGARIEYEDAEKIHALAKIGRSEFGIRADGDVVDLSNNAVTGHVESKTLLSPLASVIDDTAVIGADNGMLRIDGNGATTLAVPMDGMTIRGTRAGSDAKTFVITATNAVTLLGTDGAVRTIHADWLADDNHLIDGDISPDGGTVVVTTTAGQVALIDVKSPSTPRFWGEHMPPGSVTFAAFTPTTGKILVTGADGIARLMNSDFAVQATTFVGDAPKQAEIFGPVTVVTSPRNGIAVYDTETLALRDRIPPTVTSITAVMFDSMTRSLLGIRPHDSTEDKDASRVYIPLPTL
ncbi:TIR domain-containing protein [Nocardia takedensis]|uniref:toll/interleukin-1 receptor domain-containing protein n=1 Tax=Nocardia takedensis TaxID=259390 RepID=UPI0002F64BA3|nr:toll/interleukin-1 receptor domain-containing protein [Nocardia takedensis]